MNEFLDNGDETATQESSVDIDDGPDESTELVEQPSEANVEDEALPALEVDDTGDAPTDDAEQLHADTSALEVDDAEPLEAATADDVAEPLLLEEGQQVDLRAENAAGQAEQDLDEPELDGPTSEDTMAAAGSDLPDTALDNHPDNRELVDRLQEMDLELRSVDDFDYTDNPIRDWRTTDSREALSWMVDQWDGQIAPGLATGAEREDFADWDRASDSPLDRQVANAFDAMTGSDAIKASVRDDGSLDVDNGRHRIELARERGIAYLPARVHH